MLHRRAVPGVRVYWRSVVLALLGVLVGCATKGGPPLGGLMMVNAMRYRPATPRESPDAVAERKKARQERETLERALARGCSLSGGEGTLISEGGDLFGQGTQGYNVPGRNPDSQMPWELFLGNAAHRLIAYTYGARHPDNRAYFNTVTILEIVTEFGLGDVSRLLPTERNLRPDITDATVLYVFEIKPRNERGTQEGRHEVQAYLAALNRAVAPVSFLPGRNFQGEILVRFARGQYIWRLEWQTTDQ